MQLCFGGKADLPLGQVWETGTDGKFPFLETLNKHEPNQFCQISLRKRPVWNV